MLHEIVAFNQTLLLFACIGNICRRSLLDDDVAIVLYRSVYVNSIAIVLYPPFSPTKYSAIFPEMKGDFEKNQKWSMMLALPQNAGSE